MNMQQLFDAVLAASTPAEVADALAALDEDSAASWSPVGNRENNRGTIEVAADPGRSLVERLTNAVDAVLELEHVTHNGLPDCRSPKEAAAAWLNIPDSGLSDLSTADRQRLAKRATIALLPGASREKRVLEIRDTGIGIAADDLPSTILSLNEGNKLKKHYLAGLYGQGGSSTFAVCDYTIIASRATDDGPIAFTVVKFLDLPADLFRTGHYVYLRYRESVPTANAPLAVFARGTQVRHVGYDLSAYSSPLGPNSLYGLLNTVLFDPVMPVWLDSRVHNYRRVIKGSRNALNGAVDDGDERRSGPSLSHNVPLFFVNVAEYGRIGLEYWVLEAPTKENKQPTAAFVNPKKPIVLTHNGQNHAELSQLLVRKHAELPYLAQRLICHVDCNHLTPAAKRLLFVSNREEARRGQVYEAIEKELLRALTTDDELARLNNEARERGLRDQDESAQREMRSEVARLLRVHGLNITEPIGAEASASGGNVESPARAKRGKKGKPIPISPNEPPTYVRLIWDDEPVPFYGEQRRYLRVETDAGAHYHNVADLTRSRFNFIVTGNPFRLIGSTPLKGGRMRMIVEASKESPIGATGNVRIELSRAGWPMLADQRATVIVERPPTRPSERRVSLPPFDVRPVDGPDDPLWSELGWPDETGRVACTADMEQGVLVVHYSTVFPKFAARRAAFEKRDPAMAASFIARYQIWLAVHSLLLHSDQEAADSAPELPDSATAPSDDDQPERVRMATLAALFASREVDGTQALNVDSE